MLLSLSFLSHWFFFFFVFSQLFLKLARDLHTICICILCVDVDSRLRCMSAGPRQKKNNKNLKKGRLGGFKSNCSLKELKQEVKCVSDCLSVDLTGQGTGDGTGDGSRSSGPVQWKY